MRALLAIVILMFSMFSNADSCFVYRSGDQVVVTESKCEFAISQHQKKYQHGKELKRAYAKDAERDGGAVFEACWVEDEGNYMIFPEGDANQAFNYNPEQFKDCASAQNN